MKLIVKTQFRDKTDHVTVYEPGSILEVKDTERCADLVERGLCAEYKGRKAAEVTLGEEVAAEEPSEPSGEETAETSAAGENPQGKQP